MGNETAFSNKDIVAPRRNKPHIVLIRGFWRVSPAPRPASTDTPLWYKAHAQAERWNAIRRMAYRNFQPKGGFYYGGYVYDAEAVERGIEGLVMAKRLFTNDEAERLLKGWVK